MPSAKKNPAKKVPATKAQPEKKSAAPKKPSPGALPPASGGEEGSAEAFAELLPEAQKIPAGSVRPLRGDPALALHNVEFGLDALAPHEGELATLPAPFSLAELRSVRRAALAVVYAAAQVDRSSPGTTRTLLGQAAELRDVLLSGAVALMKGGVLPAARVKRILAGKGTRDMVQDCVDLAELFREFEKAVAGKTAVTKAQIDEASSVGNQLLTILKPARAKSRTPDGVKSAVEARDRLWTLLWNRHEQQMRRAGMWLWVEEVDAHVPALLSGSVKRGKKGGGTGGGAGGGAGNGGGNGSGG